jgi:hypothetical protein
MALQPLGYAQGTSLSTVKKLSEFSTPIPAGAHMAVIQVTTQNVRYRDDGGQPTASVGMQIAAGDSIVYNVDDLTRIRFIEEAASAVINVSYYKG